MKAKVRGMKTVACLVFLSAAAARAAYPASPNPAAILRKVSFIYSNLQNYHIEAVLHNHFVQPFSSQSVRSVISLDAAAGGRIRLALSGDGPNVLIVSDGKALWQYAPKENEYTQRVAVFLPSAPDLQVKRIAPGGLLGHMEDLLIDRFAKLQLSAKVASFAGTAKVKIHGKKIPCYRIALRSTDAKDEFWIDQSNFLVMREVIVRSMENGLKGSYATADLRITAIRTHTTPSPGLFNFKPPAGARRVAALDVPGMRDDFVGSSAGDFTLPDLHGKQISLSAFRGKTVLLDFWATWCAPCRHELPTIEKIQEQNKDKDVVILAIDDESRAVIKQFLTKNHYDFTALVDRKRELFAKFAIYSIPTVVVINGKGIVVRQIAGWEGPKELLAAVQAAQH